jgi:hypothetical protein
MATDADAAVLVARERSRRRPRVREVQCTPIHARCELIETGW